MQGRFETEYKIRVAGRHEPQVRVMHGRTQQAQIQVCVGPMVLWLASKAVVDSMFVAWNGAATYTQLPNDGRLYRPQGAEISQVVAGLTIAGEWPNCVMRVVTPRDRDPFLRMQLDTRLAIEVLDKPAYISVGSAFRQAAALAPTTFLPPVHLPEHRIGPPRRPRRTGGPARKPTPKGLEPPSRGLV